MNEVDGEIESEDADGCGAGYTQNTQKRGEVGTGMVLEQE